MEQKLSWNNFICISTLSVATSSRGSFLNIFSDSFIRSTWKVLTKFSPKTFILFLFTILMDVHQLLSNTSYLSSEKFVQIKSNPYLVF